jgi:hypothetical protein
MPLALWHKDYDCFKYSQKILKCPVNLPVSNIFSESDKDSENHPDHRLIHRKTTLLLRVTDSYESTFKILDVRMQIQLFLGSILALRKTLNSHILQK